MMHMLLNKCVLLLDGKTEFIMSECASHRVITHAHCPTPTSPHVSKQSWWIFTPSCLLLHFFLILLVLPLPTHFLQPFLLPLISTFASTQSSSELLLSSSSSQNGAST